MQALIVLSVLIASVNAVNWASCSANQADDNARLIIKSIDISPNPLHHGDSGLAQIIVENKQLIDHGSHYNVQVESSSLSFIRQLSASVSQAKLEGYVISKSSGDLCTLSTTLKCPATPADSINIQYPFHLPNVPFGGTISIEIQIWNEKNQELCCLQFDIQVKMMLDSPINFDEVYAQLLATHIKLTGSDTI